MIITIDGPVASGKSTIAKDLAKQIGFIYFDTGAMYRSFTYALIKHKINADVKEEVIAFLPKFSFDIKIKHFQRHYYVDDEDVTKEIRRREVTALVSQVASIQEVRAQLVHIQKEFSQGVNAVFEGRDMGTVVFPQADLKIFLTADAKVRAERRLEELKEKFPNSTKKLSLEELQQDISERDKMDTEREHSPLKKAKDAIEIDTSDLSIEDIVFRIMEYKDSLRTPSPETRG